MSIARVQNATMNNGEYAVSRIQSLKGVGCVRCVADGSGLDLSVSDYRLDDLELTRAISS
ncbi:hypothetical protein Cflav_PD5613 [Pedosphaera parvula Ellin514]|uniref:Uncharacterized protein n=1 Tax=Pedosphaera parvula (strain Ellin514) TaxID=320771 RepID=B9XAE3_PEDPL|nr:hypothetical protein Cflav_PD5613 [Pedosphaera parvula Ellin514]